MSDFWKGDVYAVVKAMKASGNQPGLIEQWKGTMEIWAMTHSGPDADAIKTWLPHWQARPAYTAAELAPLWPMLAIAIGHTMRIPAVAKSPNRLENELRFAGLPHREIDGRKYFIVERLHHWRGVTDKEFRDALA